MHDPEVGEQLDQYRLTELLARGGMASVFKAVDLDSGQEVVLKIPYIQYESDVVFYQRFEREEEIGQRIDHPGIVRVLAPREKSRLYLAMEYVPGQVARRGAGSREAVSVGPGDLDRQPAGRGARVPAAARRHPPRREARATYAFCRRAR